MLQPKDTDCLNEYKNKSHIYAVYEKPTSDLKTHMSPPFTWGGQSIGASASTSVLPMTIQGWFPLGSTGLISLLSKQLWRVFSNTTVQKHQFFSTQSSLWSSSHIHTWVLEKPQFWLYAPLSAKWYLCFLICCLGLPLLFFQGASIF